MKLEAFTLVEIIIAAVILALVISGMFVVFKSGERFSIEDRQKLQAQNVARQVLEHLESLNFDDSKLTKGTNKDTSNLITKDTLTKEPHVEKPNCYYNVTEIEEDYDGDGKEDVVAKKIDVVYEWKSWEEGGEQLETVNLSTVISNPDVIESGVTESLLP